ncbi:MAG: four helix bundle protein [Candidatus Paceibacterota bacterium]
MASHKDLIVWQKSYKLSLLIYSITKKFPKDEIFGLVSQMRRAAVSIPSNIAEGNTRFSSKDNAQFMRIAYGSAAELDTQLSLSKDLKYFSEKEYTEAIDLLTEVMKMLYKMLSRNI